MEQGDYSAAIRAFESVCEIAPDRPEPFRALLLAYLQAERFGDALRTGQEAIAKWPNDAELRHWVGLAYFKTGRNQEARDELQRSKELDPRNPATSFDLALVCMTLKDYAAASHALGTALKIQPSNALAHLLLGRAYQNSNRSEDAVREFQTALKLDPEVPLGHYHLGFAYESIGKTDAALAQYQVEVSRTPGNAQAHYQYGHCLLNAGDAKNAVVQLERTTELDNQNGDAFYELGKAALLNKEMPKAIAALQRAASLKPNDPSPHYQLARAYQQLGDREQAEQQRQRFLELKKAQPVMGGMATGQTQ